MPSPAFAPAHDAFLEVLGQTVTRVAIEQWSVRVLFETCELTIEGSWTLWTADGAVADRDRELGTRGRFELWRITGSQVQTIQFYDDPIPRFAMSLTGGWRLGVLGDENGLEDWGLTASGGAWVIGNGASITVFPPSDR